MESVGSFRRRRTSFQHWRRGSTSIRPLAMQANMASAGEPPRHTRIRRVDVSKFIQFIFTEPKRQFLAEWTPVLTSGSPDAAGLQEAAGLLRTTDIPVAFPTETVYGLAADATRSSAVRGIFRAKKRPPDNPLIVHIASLLQLRQLLNPQYLPVASSDPIPSRYHPLIERFWPGPLTILLFVPSPSPFAPEVTTTLPTVGVRMPSSRLALALIHAAGVPLAAPSANASTRPSPTTALHVFNDLHGRIDLILDGGPCDLGVESTVVDGLSNPPLILRPGGVSLEMLKQCPGWEDVQIGYHDGPQGGTPRAPGMKYKHYSPTARVILVQGPLTRGLMQGYGDVSSSIGVLRTKSWSLQALYSLDVAVDISKPIEQTSFSPKPDLDAGTVTIYPTSSPQCLLISCGCGPSGLSAQMPGKVMTIWTIGLGCHMAGIARGLFAALRELDSKGVGVILVESVNDQEGNAAAAIMNRLRKAAEVEIKT